MGIPRIVWNHGGIFILSFYNVVAGWAFGYFLHISFGDLLHEQNFGSFFGLFRK